jgi:excisionase family DNA binding protein
MPRSKPKPASQSVPPSVAVPAANGAAGEVLTLAEAAGYLRLPETDVVRLVEEQGLPGRQLGNEWRFLKAAIQAWLSTPRPSRLKEGIWAAAGMLKDDPYLEDMLQEIERMRGRPTAEEG